MLQDNYTQDLPIFKGANVEYLRKNEKGDGYEALIGMPVKEHLIFYTSDIFRTFRYKLALQKSLHGHGEHLQGFHHSCF